MFAEGGVAETNRPPLSCGGIEQEATIAVDKNDSAVGQVLGGFGEDSTVVSTVYLLDLARSRWRVHTTTTSPSRTRAVCGRGGAIA